MALGRLGVELMVALRLKRHLHVREVLLTGLGEDQDVDVVSVNLHKTPKSIDGLGKRPCTTRPEESKNTTGRPKMECMHSKRRDYIMMQCRPKAPTKN